MINFISQRNQAKVLLVLNGVIRGLLLLPFALVYTLTPVHVFEYSFQKNMLPRGKWRRAGLIIGINLFMLLSYYQFFIVICVMSFAMAVSLIIQCLEKKASENT